DVCTVSPCCPFLWFSCPAPAPPLLYTLSLHDALPIFSGDGMARRRVVGGRGDPRGPAISGPHLHSQRPLARRRRQNVQWALGVRSEEHTSELQSRGHLVCRLLLEKKRIDHRGRRCPVT